MQGCTLTLPHTQHLHTTTMSAFSIAAPAARVASSSGASSSARRRGSTAARAAPGNTGPPAEPVVFFTDSEGVGQRGTQDEYAAAVAAGKVCSRLPPCRAGRRMSAQTLAAPPAPPHRPHRTKNTSTTTTKTTKTATAAAASSLASGRVASQGSYRAALITYSTPMIEPITHSLASCQPRLNSPQKLFLSIRSLNSIAEPTFPCPSPHFLQVYRASTVTGDLPEWAAAYGAANTAQVNYSHFQIYSFKAPEGANFIASGPELMVG